MPALFAVGGDDLVTVAERDGPHLLGLVVAPPRPGPVKLAVQFVAGTDIDLDRVNVAITASAPDGSSTRYIARPCGPGCFMAAGFVRTAGTWSFTIRADDTERTNATFRLPLPAPDGSPVLGELRQAWERLRSVQINETFRSGTTFRIDTTYRYEAPDRAAMESSTGRAEIEIGPRSYTRESPRRPWKAGRNPFPTRLPFPFPWQRATEEPRLLADVSVDGRPAYVLAVFDPFGIWYRITVDKRSFLPVRDRMRAVGHFMDRTYTRFDQRLGIQAPIDGTDR